MPKRGHAALNRQRGRTEITELPAARTRRRTSGRRRRRSHTHPPVLTAQRWRTPTQTNADALERTPHRLSDGTSPPPLLRLPSFASVRHPAGDYLLACLPPPPISPRYGSAAFVFSKHCPSERRPESVQRRHISGQRRNPGKLRARRIHPPSTIFQGDSLIFLFCLLRVLKCEVRLHPYASSS